ALVPLPDPPAVSAIEVSVMDEAGGDERFDVVVAITAPEDLRRERSPVSSPEQRERRLIPDEEKAARADFSYVNDGTRRELDEFVAETMRALEARQPA